MRIRFSTALCASLFLPAALFCQTVTGPSIVFNTSLGNINVTLFPGDAPLNVANFLSYVNSGAYNNSFFHRSVANFIIQGGGYQWVSNAPVAITTTAAVVNEYKVPNTRGTLAMALLSGSPNSATSEWFFNTVDNSATLDSSANGPFTVIGQVADAASLAVMDQIAAEPVFNFTGTSLDPNSTGAFADLPLVNYSGTTAIATSNLVLITSITQPAVVGTGPTVGAGGIISASGFGGFTGATSGSFIEIYGTNLAGTTRGWAASDFVNGAAPTTVDGVAVTVDGIPAYVNYVSPGQVNVQVPAGIPTGAAPVVVTYSNQSSAPVNLQINAFEGGLLAPSNFKANGTQYAVALHANGTFVTFGNILGIQGTPANPLEQIVFYGVGFGPVTASSTPVAGQIVTSKMTTLASPVTFTIDGQPAEVVYQGLVEGEVGLYQFNVIVPALQTGGDFKVQVTQGGVTVPQDLYVSVE